MQSKDKQSLEHYREYERECKPILPVASLELGNRAQYFYDTDRNVSEAPSV